MASFSGICWLFGLIRSTWGGTSIQQWSSEEAILKCYESVEDAPGCVQYAYCYGRIVYINRLPLHNFGVILVLAYVH